jgi:hypothetical protein
VDNSTGLGTRCSPGFAKLASLDAVLDATLRVLVRHHQSTAMGKAFKFVRQAEAVCKPANSAAL